LPITLVFLHEGSIPSVNICSAWIILNYSFFYLSIALMAWTSIERYLFIYHERIIMRHYILLHCAPIGCIVLYGSLFYISTVILYTCEPDYDTHRYVCGGACYQYEPIFGLIDWIGNVLGTISIIIIVNITIIIRHLVQKRRMKRAVNPINRNHQWVKIILREDFLLNKSSFFFYFVASFIKIKCTINCCFNALYYWLGSIYNNCTYSNI
jgi:hypothetical protein